MFSSLMPPSSGSRAFSLWLAGFTGAVRRALFPAGLTRQGETATGPPPDPDLQLWRAGGFAIVLCFLVIASLAPFSEALPNTLLWIWLGILAAPYTSVIRTKAAHRRPSRTAGAGLEQWWSKTARGKYDASTFSNAPRLLAAAILA